MKKYKKFQDTQKIFGEESRDERFDDYKQGFNKSCAIQAQKIVLEKYGIFYSEEMLIEKAEALNMYSPETGVNAEFVGALLEEENIPINHCHNANILNITNELSQGHQIIVGVNSSNLNNIPIEQESADHAIIVSGIDTSDPDNIVVNLTDPATGEVAKAYPLNDFINAWKDSNYFMVSTTAPPPPHLNLPEMQNFDYDDDERGHIKMIGELSYEDFQEIYGKVNEINAEKAQNISNISEKFNDLVQGNGEHTAEELIHYLEDYIELNEESSENKTSRVEEEGEHYEGDDGDEGDSEEEGEHYEDDDGDEGDFEEENEHYKGDDGDFEEEGDFYE